MIHETHTDTGKWLELDPGVQRTIAIRTWFFDCRLIVNNNNNNNMSQMNPKEFVHNTAYSV